jgi:hypothetical protein
MENGLMEALSALLQNIKAKREFQIKFLLTAWLRSRDLAINGPPDMPSMIWPKESSEERS